MANTSGHNEEMEDFVGAESFVPGVENGKLQRIDHSSDGVDDAADQQPEKSGQTQGGVKSSEDQYAYPAHGDIQDGGEPFGAGYPAGFDQHSHQSYPPDKSQQLEAGGVSQNDHAYRSVGTCDQYKDHHVIQFLEDPEGFPLQIHRVVSGAGAV